MDQERIRNFCIIAHIDHGKSTLADRMLELTGTIPPREMKPQLLDQLELERERGITIKLAPVRMFWTPTQARAKTPNLEPAINPQAPQPATPHASVLAPHSKLTERGYILNLIDTPGHVDFSYEVSRSLAAVEGAILLVDATQGIQAQTLSTLYQALEQNLTIVPAVNKIDLPQADPEGAAADLASLLGGPASAVLRLSGKTGQGVSELLAAVIERIPPPTGLTDAPARALVFDSIFDPYRGVVALVRVVDGSLAKGDPIRFIATGATGEALEVGIFRPQFTPIDRLGAGEIGYVVTSLKEVRQARVGDTITSKLQRANHNFKPGSSDSSLASWNWSVEPLPGYKEPIPMVFAGFYPVEGEVEKLRDALGKLKLNDAALNYEPTSSKAFGLGFRAGFLGLLHMEIIKERLEREYGLGLIVTIPSVAYHERLEGGKTVYAEPWVRVELLTPEIYLGPVMELAQSRRGIYQSTEYLGTSDNLKRVLVRYELPLAELITDFYDELKSRTSGYASLSYEFIDYREEDLVRLDILVADERIDVLSQIVHRTAAERRAREIVKRLKDLIPRQWFEVKIQAAVGGKILARENIAALKKDVTGYLYGGDITRKRKLWAKQAKGKKKMQKLGKVNIPSDVFIQLLKKT